MKLAILPQFPGFYESIFSSGIDQEVESYQENEGTKDYPDYTVDFEALASQICQQFAHETKIPLKFESLSQPRECNFQTDKIFAEISLKNLYKIKKETDLKILQETVKKNHSSRDGFISFYPSNLAEWPKALKDWDHNHLCTLLEAYFKTKETNLDDLYFAIYETMSGNGEFYRAITFENRDE